MEKAENKPSPEKLPRSPGNVLPACMGKSRALNSLIEYAPDSIVSKTILDKTVGTITLFAFDAGQKLSEHTAPYDAVVQVIDGDAALTIGGKSINVSAGEIIIMPANVPHAVAAEGKFKMLLTMIRA
jgi:quercetin dioxygenase-like cupin family protein